VRGAIQNFAIPTGMLNQLRIAGAGAMKAAPKVGVPTLIVQGADDTLVTPANTRALAAKIAGSEYFETVGEHQLLDERTPSAKIVGDRSLAFTLKHTTK
jgi:pimeloyl-ACP methyl ester carboxylesterase